MTTIQAARSVATGPLVPEVCAASVPRIAVHGPRSPDRAVVEAFVAAAYSKHFGARLTAFMPQLFAMHDDVGRPHAVVGCRDAAEHSLFLEQYTGKPIEALLCERLGVDAAREEIVEVGNLACTGPRSALAIVRALIPFMIHAGYVWVVFTAADTVLGVFRRLALEPHRLCAADPRVLGEAADAWGTYYEHAPVVMAGRLLDGLCAAGRRQRSRA